MALTVEQYLRPDVIQQVQRLDLKARFIVDGTVGGLRRTLERLKPPAGTLVTMSSVRYGSPLIRTMSVVRAPITRADSSWLVPASGSSRWDNRNAAEPSGRWTPHILG